jgi:hypothetical protein
MTHGGHGNDETSAEADVPEFDKRVARPRAIMACRTVTV